MSDSNIGPEAATYADKDGPIQPVKQTTMVDAIELEHKLTIWQAIKLYPTAIFWSCFVSMGVIMAAFDPTLLGNLYATPQFDEDFGYLYKGQVSSRFCSLYMANGGWLKRLTDCHFLVVK